MGVRRLVENLLLHNHMRSFPVPEADLQGDLWLHNQALLSSFLVGVQELPSRHPSLRDDSTSMGLEGQGARAAFEFEQS